MDVRCYIIKLVRFSSRSRSQVNMLNLKKAPELLIILNGSDEGLDRLGAYKTINMSDLNADVASILEGIIELRSLDGQKCLIKVQDLVDTLNPDFDDDDYDDPYAEVWEAFVSSLSNEKIDYLILLVSFTDDGHGSVSYFY